MKSRDHLFINFIAEAVVFLFVASVLGSVTHSWWIRRLVWSRGGVEGVAVEG